MQKLSAMIVLLALLFIPVRSGAQTPDDETRIRDLAVRWEKAWNRHDMKSLATLLTEDADFVNVAGRHVLVVWQLSQSLPTGMCCDPLPVAAVPLWQELQLPVMPA